MRINSGSNPLPARPPVAPAAPAGAPEPNVIEADLGLQLTAGNHVAGHGGVHLSRAFVERLVRRVTHNRKSISDVKVAYDPKVGAYTGSATVQVKGMTLNLVGRARPAVSQNQPAIKFEELGVKVGGMTIKNPLLTHFATKYIAEEISKSRIDAQAEKGMVRLDPNTLMYKIKAMPDFLRIDSGATTLSTEMGADGDVRFQLKSDAPAGRSETSQSDLQVAASAQDLQYTLLHLLHPSYDVEKVTFGNGTITIDGKAEVKVLSDIANAGKLIAGLIQLAGGQHPGSMQGGRAMAPLKLTAKIDGTRVLLTPSIKQALPQIEKLLTEKNATPQRVGDSLSFDLAALAPRMGLKDVVVTPEGLKAKARIDIPGMIKSPILRGEQIS